MINWVDRMYGSLDQDNSILLLWQGEDVLDLNMTSQKKVLM